MAGELPAGADPDNYVAVGGTAWNGKNAKGATARRVSAVSIICAPDGTVHLVLNDGDDSDAEQELASVAEGSGRAAIDDCAVAHARGGAERLAAEDVP